MSLTPDRAALVASANAQLQVPQHTPEDEKVVDALFTILVDRLTKHDEEPVPVGFLEQWQHETLREMAAGLHGVMLIGVCTPRCRELQSTLAPREYVKCDCIERSVRLIRL